MNLSTEQLTLLKKGEPIRILVPDLGEVVVVRAEVYDQMYDSGDWTEEEMGLMAGQAFEDVDNAGPIQ